MFPLAGKAFPSSPDELATAIHDALAEVITFPKKSSAVTLEGGKWPAIKHAKVDLSGASISAGEPPPPPPKAKGKRTSGVEVDQLDVIGHPFHVEESKLNLTLKAHKVSFDFAHDAKGQATLVLTDAKDGQVQVKITKNDLQSMLLAAATLGAKQQGVTIQDLQIDLTSESTRSIDAEVRVKAKKMMMSGVVLLRGRAEIDDSLVATLSNLSCTGEGMVGGMAAAMLTPKLRAFEGKRFPLMAFSLGDVSLRDLKITAGETISVTAEFGRKA